MITKTFAFLLIGRLLIFYVQKAPYLNFLKKWAFWKELLECDLCLGWWVYFGLSIGMREVWLNDIFLIPVFSEFITASIASFVMWLIADGWNNKFRELNVTFEE